jgi:hypothetical protein
MQGSTITTTYYFDAFGVHSEGISYGGPWQVNDYLMVGRSMVGMRVVHNDGSFTLRYFHQDHLGRGDQIGGHRRTAGASFI